MDDYWFHKIIVEMFWLWVGAMIIIVILGAYIIYFLEKIAKVLNEAHDNEIL